MSTTSSQSSASVAYKVTATYFLFPPSVPGFQCGGYTATADLGQFHFPLLGADDRVRTDSAWDGLTPAAEKRALEAWAVVLQEAVRLIADLTPAFGGWEVKMIRCETDARAPVRLLRAYSSKQEEYLVPAHGRQG